MRTPLISVIIPTFNCCQRLPKAARSILRQSYDRVELVIVDDGSSDNTWRVIADLRRLDPRVISVATDHAGISAARNAGLASCTGDYIAFLDDDEFSRPKRLERQIAYRQTYERPGPMRPILCTCDFIAVYTGARPRSAWYERVPSERCFTLPTALGAFPPPSTWLLSRDTAERLSEGDPGHRRLFDPDITAIEDIDLIVRAFLSDTALINVQEPLVFYRTAKKTYPAQKRSHLRFYEKNLASLRRLVSEADYQSLQDAYRKLLSL